MGVRSRKLLMALAVFAAAVLFYAFAVTGATHLRLDDWGYTLGCPFVKDGLSAANAARAFGDLGNGGIWMPLTYLSYMLDRSLGFGWQGIHYGNVLLHAAVSVTVFFFLLALLRRDGEDRSWPCFLAALCWALHPLRAEAVVWIAARKELLWSLFALLGLLSWLKFVSAASARNYGYYVAAFAAFLLACLSKPTAVAFPLLAYLLEWRSSGFRDRRPSIAGYVPFLAVSAVTGLIAVCSQSRPTGLGPVEIGDTPLLWRLLNAAVSLGMYLFKTVLPVGLHTDYRAVPGGIPLGAGIAFAALAAAAAGLCFLFRIGRRRQTFPGGFRETAFALAFALAAVLPVLGVLGFVGDKAYADYYVYLPSVAAAFLLALGLSAAPERCRRLALVLPVALAALGWAPARALHNDFAAYSRALAFDGGHWRALRTLGCEYCVRPDGLDRGIEMLRRSHALHPVKLTADTYAYALASRGAPGDGDEVKRVAAPLLEAVTTAATASKPRLDAAVLVRLDPGGMMLDALGITALREGDDESAVSYLSAALCAPRRAHANVHTMLHLGFALANAGRPGEAIGVLDRLENVNNPEIRKRARAAVAAIEAGRRERLAP